MRDWMYLKIQSTQKWLKMLCKMAVWELQHTFSVYLAVCCLISLQLATKKKNNIWISKLNYGSKQWSCEVTQCAVCCTLASLYILPLIFNSTWGIVSWKVVGQDDPQQLQSNRVVLTIWVSATNPLVYQTSRAGKEIKDQLYSIVSNAH